MFSLIYNSFWSIFLCKLTTHTIHDEISSGRLIRNSKTYTTFNRGIRSSFETYRQHFKRFANLAFDFIKILFTKIQLAFELFLQNQDSYEVCN